MIPCISSQPYDLITGKCHIHLSAGTDVWKERQADLIFFLLVYVSLIFLEGKASLFDLVPTKRVCLGQGAWQPLGDGRPWPRAPREVRRQPGRRAKVETALRV